MLHTRFAPTRTWWCVDCRQVVRAPVCARCGHAFDEARVRCLQCGGISRSSLGGCPNCGTELPAWRATASRAKPAPPPETVVVSGILIEDRTPAAPVPAPGAKFARVPRQVPWFDALSLGTALAGLGGYLWLDRDWPGWAVILVLVAPVVVLGLVRRLRPDLWQQIRGRLRPALEFFGRRVPEIRRIVVQSDLGALVGVEIAHPNRWPPERAFPAVTETAPLRLRCDGDWIQPERLLRAVRISVVDEQGSPIAPPVRAGALQTFSMALGLVTLMILAGILTCEFRPPVP